MLEDRRSRTEGIELSFGTCIHAAIERLKCATGPRPDVDTTCGLFEVELRAEHDRIKGSARKPYDIEQYVVAGRRIIERIDDCAELASSRVLFNEHRLLAAIDRTDDVTMNFKGYVDVIFRTVDKRGNPVLYVADFKTCGWGWGVDKRRDINKHRQLLLYKHFVCREFSLDPKHVRCAFILLKKKPGKNDAVAELVQIPAGPKAVQDALDELNRDISAMAAGAFVKNRSACVNDFGEACPYMNTDLCQT